jgi:hypothetical protein
VRQPGLNPSFPDASVNLDGSGIDLHSQDAFQVTLTYDGSSLRETIEDNASGASFTTSYLVDIPAVLGGTQAYVGFTGGSGGFTAVQDIETWTGTFPPPASFLAAPTYAAGSSVGPIASAVGDFNGDGIPDLAVVDNDVAAPGQGFVSILLGKGDGSFQAPRKYAVAYGSSLAVGDFNGDGHLDIVTSSGSILLGNGDGTFQAAQSYGTQGSFFSVGDFNRDGKLDLALINNSANMVNVLLGNGDGTFQSPYSYDSGPFVNSLAAADFNGDGIPDLVVSSSGFVNGYNYGQVSVALGHGDGTFGTFYSYGNPASSLVVGDFNGDGHLDIVTNAGDILLGNGDGTFQAPRSYSARNFTTISVGDFNGDGHLDLACSVVSGVHILLGNGDGTFQNSSFSYAIAGYIPSSLAVADWNADGHSDVAAVANGFKAGAEGAVTVLMNNGDGTFRAARSFPDGAGAGSVVVADLNGDGKQDVVTANFDYVVLPPRLGGNRIVESDVEVFLGNGDGTFLAPHTYNTGGGPLAVAVGDFNGDGIPDLAVANGGFVGYMTPPNSTVAILLGNGDGTFQPAQTDTVGPGAFSVVVGDFNGDGHLDLAVADASGILILLGKGDGTFQAGQRYAVSAGSLILADFNRDGKLDIATSGGSLLLGNGDGTFQPAQSYAGPGANAVAVGDFNGDGIPDLALAIVSGPDDQGTVSILLGNGDGGFRPAQSYPVGLNPNSIAVGDLNGDGLADLAVTNEYSHTVSILLGNSDGTFQAAQNYAAGSYPNSVAAADFNGDGLPDLAVAGSTLAVLIHAPVGGGRASIPPRRPGTQPRGYRQSQPELMSATMVALQRHESSALPLASIDLQPEPNVPWPVEATPGPLEAPEPAFSPIAVAIARDVHDAVFERWVRCLLDDALVVASRSWHAQRFTDLLDQDHVKGVHAKEEEEGRPRSGDGKCADQP